MSKMLEELRMAEEDIEKSINKLQMEGMQLMKKVFIKVKRSIRRP